ncbi:hypothetical protein ACEQ8H_006212 [Pleosporales sp. CAS-2024a]
MCEPPGTTNDMLSAQAQPSLAPNGLGQSAAERDYNKNEKSQIAYVLPSVAAVAIAFLDNVKRRFGHGSYETAAIFGALEQFRQSLISKRQTISRISEILGTHYDLKSDLKKVLEHPDARWEPADFDLPLAPAGPALPQFLEPRHEPQIRFLAPTTPWTVQNSQLSGRNLPAPNTLNQQSDLERLDETERPKPKLDAHFWHTYSHAVPPSPVASNGPATPAHIPLMMNQQIGRSLHSQPENLLHQAAAHWNHSEVPPQFSGVPYQGRVEYGHSRVNQALTDYSEEMSRPDPWVQWSVPDHPDATPVAAGDQDHQMLPRPPRKRSRKSSATHSKKEDGQKRSNAAQEPHHLAVQSTGTPLSKRSISDGQFIHSLCGRTFTRRSAVKKHHWGNKADDVDTMTGCWYKHNKPDVSWNDHPSCKGVPESTPPRSRRAKCTRKIFKAPVAPSMVPSSRYSAPGFSAPQDLPQSRNSTMYDSYLPYHSHGLPKTAAGPDSSYKSFLAAMNVAAKVKQPRPKSRMDSVALHGSDGQSGATKQSEAHGPVWTPGRGDQSNQEHMPSCSGNKLGYALPSSTLYESQMPCMVWGAGIDGS